MKKFNLLFLFLFCIIWSNSFCQTNTFNKVYEGSFGYFTDEIYSYNRTQYNGPLFIDFGIGKQNDKKRRLFHLNYKQTQTKYLNYLHNYRSFGVDYTKTTKLFSFDRNGIFIGTSYSLEYAKTNSKPNIDTLYRFMAKNVFGAINFKAEYIHFIKKDIYVNIGVRLNIVEAGWEYLERISLNLEKRIIRDNPNTPPPFQFERINLYIGFGFYKLKSENAK